MRAHRLSLIVLLCALAVPLAAAGTASGKAIYSYEVQATDAAYNGGTPSGYISVRRIDTLRPPLVS